MLADASKETQKTQESKEEFSDSCESCETCRDGADADSAILKQMGFWFLRYPFQVGLEINQKENKGTPFK